jgi:hypothetical protein
MADEMTSIPPRVGTLEQGLHTLTHRINALEDTHKDMPHRLTKVEVAVERLPAIDNRLGKLEEQVKAGFNKVIGVFWVGSTFMAIAIAFGPSILKMLKG